MVDEMPLYPNFYRFHERRPGWHLDTAGKYYELKVYLGKPHGFMIANGSLATDDAATDAYNQMISFFQRMLV